MAEQNNTVIGLSGISYRDNYNRYVNIDVCVDFRHSYNNYQEKLLNHSAVDCYISTYNHNLVKELLEFWNPQEYILVNDRKFVGDKTLSRNMNLINVCRLIVNAQKSRGRPYDKVILTRFDLLFEKNFTDLPVNMDCLNITARCERDPLIDDNIYIMHGSKLNDFYEIVNNAWRSSCHTLFNEFHKKIGVNFLHEGNYHVIGNPLFKIVKLPSTAIKDNSIHQIENNKPHNIPHIMVCIWGNGDNIVDNLDYFNKHITDPLFFTHNITITIAINSFQQSQFTNTCKSVLLFSFIKNNSDLYLLTEAITSQQLCKRKVYINKGIFLFINASAINDNKNNLSTILEAIKKYKTEQAPTFNNIEQIISNPFCILNEDTVNKLYLQSLQ